MPRRTVANLIRDLYVPRSSAPTVNDDATKGFVVGSRWLDTSVSPAEEWLCVNAAAGAAVWENTTSQSRYVVKAAATVRTNTATPADDPDLLFAIGASQTWEFEFLALIGTDATVNGLKIAVSAPAGVTSVNYLAQFAPSVAVAAGQQLRKLDTSASAALTLTISENGALHVRGLVVNGSTAGNVALQWSQGTLNAGNLTLQANSWLKATRVA